MILMKYINESSTPKNRE